MGADIIQTNDNLAQTSIKNKKNIELEVENIKIDKKEMTLKIPVKNYIIYSENNKIKMLCFRYEDEIVFKREGKKFSVTISKNPTV